MNSTSLLCKHEWHLKDKGYWFWMWWLKSIYQCYLSSCYWMLDISQTVSYEITLVSLSVCLSVRPSLNFLKTGSLVFCDIVHDDSWSWYLVTDETRFLKNVGDWNLIPTDLSWAKMRFFTIFFSVDDTFLLKLLVMIACDNV